MQSNPPSPEQVRPAQSGPADCEELFRALQTRLEQAQTARAQCQVQIVPPVLLSDASVGISCDRTLPGRKLVPAERSSCGTSDEHEQTVQRYRTHQLEQHGFVCATRSTDEKTALNLFDARYFKERLRKPWARLEIELQVNRLLVYLESVPDEERSCLKTWLLRELFAHRLGAERVQYEEGVIRGIRGLVRKTDGDYRWEPVTTTPAIMAERVREIIAVEKGPVQANGIIPLMRQQPPALIEVAPPTPAASEVRQKVALKPR